MVRIYQYIFALGLSARHCKKQNEFLQTSMVYILYIIHAQVRWGRVKLGDNKSATWKWEEDTEIFVALLLLPQVIFIRFHLKNGWSSAVRESGREKHSFSFLARSRVDVRTDTPIIAIAQFDSHPPIYTHIDSVLSGVQRSLHRSFTCRAVREGAKYKPKAPVIASRVLV